MAQEGTTAVQIDRVTVAVHLGWRLVELYGDPLPSIPDESWNDIQRHVLLPTTPSEFDPRTRSLSLVAQVSRDIAMLSNEGGTTVKQPEIAKLLTEGNNQADGKRKILETYVRLVEELPAFGDHLDTALRLGVMLASMAPHTAAVSSDSLKEPFARERLSVAYGWLDELRSSLPSNVAEAVGGSLFAWEHWVDFISRGPLTPAQSESAASALRDQCEVWERLLCGDKQAEELLSTADYWRAGTALAWRFGALVYRSVRGWGPTVLLVLIGAAALTWGILSLHLSSISTTIALIATAAGGLGISWKSITAVLGRVLSAVTTPIWNKELARSIVLAATRTPESATSRARGSGSLEQALNAR